MRDESVARATELFHQASRLLSDLTALGRSLPEPNMPDKGLPPNWNDRQSYALCVAQLRRQLDFVFGTIKQSLQIRNELHIASVLFPPQAEP